MTNMPEPKTVEQIDHELEQLRNQADRIVDIIDKAGPYQPPPLEPDLVTAMYRCAALQAAATYLADNTWTEILPTDLADEYLQWLTSPHPTPQSTT